MTTTWVALLARINVGTRRIKMPKLAGLFESAGATGVVTYVQSGNVVFDHELDDPVELVEQLAPVLSQGAGFDISFVVRTADELDRIIADRPYDEPDPKLLSVLFLDVEPTIEIVDTVAANATPAEGLTVVGTAAYLHLPDGTGRSKLAARSTAPGAGRHRSQLAHGHRSGRPCTRPLTDASFSTADDDPSRLVPGRVGRHDRRAASFGSPNGIRTRVSTLRGWCPRPLDDGAKRRPRSRGDIAA